MLSFSFARDPTFLTKIFVYPSIIFVILAYTTFWIDSRKASARVIFSTTNVMNSISLVSSTTSYIPQVPIRTWLQNFLIWNLVFTMIPMIQFAILNAASVTLENRKKKIEDLINEMRAYASRTDNPDDPDQLLHESRKRIAKEVRATITGGDVLMIEDFQIQMNSFGSNGAKQKKGHN